ncbi:MAG: hypothetical protein AB7N90_10265 [Vicinamibacterales bacterium]
MRAARLSALLLAASSLVLSASPQVAAQGGGTPTVLEVPGLVTAVPWVAADGAFVAVAFGASRPGAGGSDVYVAMSRDGGRRFDAPVRVNAVEGEARLGGDLPPRIALAPAAGAAPGIVVAYGVKAGNTSIVVARSRDGGRTFAPATRMQAEGAAGDRGWQALAVDDAGAAHVLWLDHRGLAAQKSKPTEHDHMDGAAMAQLSGLYYASTNGQQERELVKGVCYCCKTALATAPGGRLFAAWRQVYPGNIRDIAFLASTDGGRTFSAPARVSDDGWQLAGCPDDGPALAVDASGRAHIAWPTVIGGDTPEGAIFYASTADGQRFTPRLRVPTLGAPRPQHPQVVVTGPGQVAIAWDESTAGRRQAAVRALRIDGSGTGVFGDALLLGGAEASTYPVLAVTSEGLLAAWTAGPPTSSHIAVALVTPPAPDGSR